MNIKFKTCLAGVDHTWNVGDVASVPDQVDAAEAGRLIEAEFAEETSDPPGRVADRWVEKAGAEPVKAGVEYRGKTLFGAAAKAVLRKLQGAAK